MGRKVGFCCVITLAAALVARADTVTLTPDKDTTLIQATAGNLSSGRGDSIYVGRTASYGVRRPLIHFNLSALPSSINVTSVSLRLTAQKANGNRTVILHRVLQDWGEGTSNSTGGAGVTAAANDATWLYRFYNTTAPTSSPLWTTPGGSFNSAISGSGLCPAAAGNFTFSSSAQMIADIRAWLSDPTNNFGWELIGDESTTRTAAKVFSRDYATASVRPTLTITYTVPEPASLLLLTGFSALIASRRRS